MLRSRKMFFAAFLVLAGLLIFVTPALAAPVTQDTPQAPTLDIFLQWLVSGGGSILAVSWLLERMKWFQMLTSDQKDYTVFGSAGVLGCAALAAVMYVPQPIKDAAAPFFLVLATVFVGVFLMKTFHKADKVG